jgi:hypothetical protein
MGQFLLSHLRLEVSLVPEQFPFLFGVVILGHFQRHQSFSFTIGQVVLVFVLQVLHFLLVELQFFFILLGGFLDLTIFIPANFLSNFFLSSSARYLSFALASSSSFFVISQKVRSLSRSSWKKFLSSLSRSFSSLIRWQKTSSCSRVIWVVSTPSMMFPIPPLPFPPFFFGGCVNIDR